MHGAGIAKGPVFKKKIFNTILTAFTCTGLLV